MKRENRKSRREQRQQEAAIRQEEYDKLSTDDKISRAKARRGNSKKELKRLFNRLDVS